MSDIDNPTIDEAKEILAQVSLKSFTATPKDIGAFGASILSWVVLGPHGRISVYLDKARVHTSGAKAVQPKSTTQYALRAAAGDVSKKLGTVTVNVNVSDCITFSWLNVRSLIEGLIRTGVNRVPNLYFRSLSPGAVVTFEPGRIRFKLYLGYHLENKPDPDIDIDASFVLDVHDGAFVSRSDRISVSVRVPDYLWLLPGAPIWLPIVLSEARQDTTQSTQAAIQGIVQGLNRFYTSGEGMRLQNVQIVVEEDTEGDVLITECPFDLLRRFAVISASEIVVEPTGK